MKKALQVVFATLAVVCGTVVCMTQTGCTASLNDCTFSGPVNVRMGTGDINAKPMRP